MTKQWMSLRWLPEWTNEDSWIHFVFDCGSVNQSWISLQNLRWVTSPFLFKNGEGRGGGGGGRRQFEHDNPLVQQAFVTFKDSH